MTNHHFAFEFTTPDLFDDHRGSVDVAESGLHHYGAKTSFYGQAVTVTCPEDNSKAVEALKTDGTGKILVINGFASKKYAFVGDIMADNAIKNNWQGVVINGCVRDIEILKDMQLGVMALGCVPRSTVKRGVGDTAQNVELLSITVKPNDWLYADVNGLIVSQQPLHN
ncbi:putative 4-hydroxy-4-methyl-2-oxoglutarate aldolase [Paraglaciecola aquimarina]|uniref:4-hydroxy-4-methyl-2-oxoglutarate aldolase n=1 Tax=Paraglaciecola aquimarina TaxID=1235557 RepID=A0ABU3SYG4_9ALTE|nr:putative 4-hydroxy-4-methyl-2-oxoglutarate aldolase [Paraglaciecola aquimarina]MDU0355046.1 putative 4-hydroxy-4-methyl-2-oxoglutarate aldolase [Paraglaciecola aquimarina]